MLYNWAEVATGGSPYEFRDRARPYHNAMEELRKSREKMRKKAIHERLVRAFDSDSEDEAELDAEERAALEAEALAIRAKRVADGVFRGSSPAPARPPPSDRARTPAEFAKLGILEGARKSLGGGISATGRLEILLGVMIDSGIAPKEAVLAIRDVAQDGNLHNLMREGTIKTQADNVLKYARQMEAMKRAADMSAAARAATLAQGALDVEVTDNRGLL